MLLLTHPNDVLTLSETDRSRLQTFVHRGQESARRRTRAQVLLKLGEGWSLEAVCAAFDVCRNTAVRVRRRFQEGGVCSSSSPDSYCHQPRFQAFSYSL